MNSVCIGCIGRHITLLLGWRHFKNCPTSTSLYVVMIATFKIKHLKSKGMLEKNQIRRFSADRKFCLSGSLFCITQQSLVMPNSDPHDRIFNLHLTAMKDSYNLDHESSKSVLGCWFDPILPQSLQSLRLRSSLHDLVKGLAITACHRCGPVQFL